ncbi:ribose-5-phosphate isomerase RpiA [Paenibacillus alginolyticus]|uniref:Ribose-5-phosphate isomerase A n=1 Tax=Paenibacillus alginolyticus TaxID=59839 RepID=A0ABT4GM96_9BACL|nr:ribose-5-phosphate isomerase RpiA [Paenibacillus alginolyticus]MCY9697324.1 ribose-5-phosphate isomerase RpiA [Paenibacillus alginolyticus]MEC0144033.1 ribose-5-phosphate isomerase RpiA [Paenibacillus alginolyticus]
MNPKQLAAEKAVEFIEDGMVVGLGTGSTAYWAIHKIAQRIQEGLRIRAVASSRDSEELANKLGIPMVPFSEIEVIDLTIDGADEVDPHLNLIKGGGGALVREKILASNSKRFFVIVDESKRVEHLGQFPLPVEIVPFAANFTINKLKELGCNTRIRMSNDKEYITDNGNIIVDCNFEKIVEPKELNKQINLIPGVVDNGLFTRLVSSLIIGYNDGKVMVIDQP